MTKPAALSLNALYSNSVTANSLTDEAADRVAIRELIDAWGHCADRRRAEQQGDQFTADGMVAIYEGEPGTKEPVAVHQGQTEIVAALDALNKYDVTTHFNGQSDVIIDWARAIGETYCLAHHLWVENGQCSDRFLHVSWASSKREFFQLSNLTQRPKPRHDLLGIYLLDLLD